MLIFLSLIVLGIPSYSMQLSLDHSQIKKYIKYHDIDSLKKIHQTLSETDFQTRKQILQSIEIAKLVQYSREHDAHLWNIRSILLGMFSAPLLCLWIFEDGTTRDTKNHDCPSKIASAYCVNSYEFRWAATGCYLGFWYDSIQTFIKSQQTLNLVKELQSMTCEPVQQV